MKLSMSARQIFVHKFIIFLLTAFFSVSVFAKESAQLGLIGISSLPKEGQATLLLIKQGGPFPYEKDGKVFGNYEVRLPKKQRGYYHEYTVKTPRARNRGARRIIAGGHAMTSGEYYYTDDHYETFKRIQP